jgi:hypothetical protein
LQLSCCQHCQQQVGTTSYNHARSASMLAWLLLVGRAGVWCGVVLGWDVVAWLWFVQHWQGLLHSACSCWRTMVLPLLALCDLCCCPWLVAQRTAGRQSRDAFKKPGAGVGCVFSPASASCKAGSMYCWCGFVQAGRGVGMQEWLHSCAACAGVESRTGACGCAAALGRQEWVCLLG